MNAFIFFLVAGALAAMLGAAVAVFRERRLARGYTPYSKVEIRGHRVQLALVALVLLAIGCGALALIALA